MEDRRTCQQKGQILIIFLGLLSVALGIGLAGGRRSLSALRSGNLEALSAQAYFSAESGIEEALVNSDLLSCAESFPCEGSFGDSCSYSYYAEETSDLAISLEKDRLFSLDTTGYTGTIRFLWNRGDLPADANALQVIQVDEAGGTVSSGLLGYACGMSLSGFSPAGAGSGGYHCSTGDISLAGDTAKLVVKMLKAGGVGAGDITYSANPDSLGAQALAIYSTGVCGKSSRQLKVTKLLNDSGQDFSFGLFLPNSDLSL